MSPDMDRETFCRQSAVVIVAGKGGVGKTTVTAALARMACEVGLKTLVVELDNSAALPKLFGCESCFDYEETTLYQASDPTGQVVGRVITPDDALMEYLENHGLHHLGKRLVSSGVLEVVSSAIPGIREVLVLGKVKQIEVSGAFDLIVVDAPAAGHAVTFLTSALGLVAAARSGPLRSQAQEVVEMLTDSTRCQVMLVGLPEETPVNELIETAFRFEDLVGIALAPVVVNACYRPLAHLGVDPLVASREARRDPPGPDEAAHLVAAARFRATRQELQAVQLARLTAGLPLPQLVLPFQFTATFGPRQLTAISESLGSAVDELEMEFGL